MKKLILGVCLAFLSVGAYAAEDAPKTTKETKTEKKFYADYTFTSSCGEVWDVHTSPGLSWACHVALINKMEEACGTSTSYVEVQEGNDC